MARVEVNKKAAAIEMKDYQGEHFSLEALEGEKWVLLVLNRGFT